MDEAIALVVDQDGIVLKVVTDRLGLTDPSFLSANFLQLFAGADMLKAARFFFELEARGAARDWELVVPHAGKLNILRFSGRAHEQGFLVFAGTSGSRRLSTVVESQVPLVPDAREESAAGPERDYALYDELAGMNNDLVNLRREMLKANSLVEELQREKNRLLSWLDGFFSASTAGLAIYDKDLRFVQVNEAIAAMSGISIEEHLGRTPREALPEVGYIIEPLLKKVLETGRAILDFKVQGETAAAPGELRQWQVSWFPLRDNSGELAGVGAVVVETTGRMRAEQQNVFQASLLAQVRNAVIAADTTGQIIYWNQAAERLFGWTAAEVMGRATMATIVPPSEAAAALELRAAVLAGRPWHGEFLLRRKDGSTFVSEISNCALLDEAGLPKGIVAVASDISDRKSAETTIRASEHRFATLFRSIPIPISYVEDHSGRIIDVNDQYVQLFGYARAELVGRLPEELGIWDRDERHQLIAETLKHGGVKSREITLYRRSGEAFPALASMAHTAEGDAAGIITMIVDLTERKKAEDALTRSHHQMRALADRLTTIREQEARRISRELHDQLGQQLTALKMDLALMGPILAPPVAAAAMGRVRGLVERTIETVQKISGELRLGQLDRLGLAAAMEMELGEFSVRTGILCDTDGMEEIEDLERRTATALFRIFQETLTNVARHARATRIRVRLQSEERRVVMEIADNGRGITDGEIDDASSIGIVGMQERILAVGGQFRIGRGAKGGTTVAVSVKRNGARPHDATEQLTFT